MVAPHRDRRAPPRSSGRRPPPAARRRPRARSSSSSWLTGTTPRRSFRRSPPPGPTCAGPGRSCRGRSGSCATSCGWSPVWTPTTWVTVPRGCAGYGRWWNGAAQIGGVVEHTMRRDDALAFFRIGQQLERADLTCRTLVGPRRGGAPIRRRRCLHRGPSDGTAAIAGLLSAVPTGHAGQGRRRIDPAVPPPGRGFAESGGGVPGRGAHPAQGAPPQRAGRGGRDRCRGAGRGRPRRGAHPARVAGVPARARKGDRGRP